MKKVVLCLTEYELKRIMETMKKKKRCAIVATFSVEYYKKDKLWASSTEFMKSIDENTDLSEGRAS